MTFKYFNNNMDNYELFCNFIQKEDKRPISLSLTTLVLDERKLIEEEGFKAKRHSQLLVKKQQEIAKSMIVAKANAEQINAAKDYEIIEVRSGYELKETD